MFTVLPTLVAALFGPRYFTVNMGLLDSRGVCHTKGCMWGVGWGRGVGYVWRGEGVQGLLTFGCDKSGLPQGLSSFGCDDQSRSSVL